MESVFVVALKFVSTHQTTELTGVNLVVYGVVIERSAFVTPNLPNGIYIFFGNVHYIVL